jgi:hypothetical protein
MQTRFNLLSVEPAVQAFSVLSVLDRLPPKNPNTESTGKGHREPGDCETGRTISHVESVSENSRRVARELRNGELCGVAIHRGMTNIASRDHVDHVLGNVRGMIRNAFEILGHEDQLERGEDH